MTERKLRDKNITYEVGHTNFKSVTHAQMTDKTVGMLKIFFSPATLQIFGVQCFGSRSSDHLYTNERILLRDDFCQE